MGQPLECVCIDCKKIYYIGYGSSNLYNSERYKSFMNLHGNHEHKEICDDYFKVLGNDLVTDFPYDTEADDKVAIEGYANFERIDFD